MVMPSNGDLPMPCSGTAEDEELVTSKAICAAFIAEDGGQYSSQVAKQLLTAGNGKAHDSILQAMAFCTRLADADALSQEDPGIHPCPVALRQGHSRPAISQCLHCCLLGTSKLIRRVASNVCGLSECQHQHGSAGELAQYGKHNMKYGTVVQMPKSWWKAFPPYRRKG